VTFNGRSERMRPERSKGHGQKTERRRDSEK
jgi:hypothetical protein